MTALRSLACILMLFACLHSGLFALTDMLVGVLGHAVVTVLEPKDGEATSEQKEGASKARKSFTWHLVRGTARGLVACAELVAAIYAFTMKRRSLFMPIAGALSVGSALLRAWDIPGERIEHVAKNLPPPEWYQVQPSGTWFDFAPSALHALGGALVILLGVLHWNAQPPRPAWQASM
jgi:hypothetical protein